MSGRGRKSAAAKVKHEDKERIEILTFSIVNSKGNKIKKLTRKDEIELGNQVAKMVLNQLDGGHIIDSQIDGSTYILSIGMDHDEELDKDQIGENIVDTVEAQDDRKIFLRYKKDKSTTITTRKSVSPTKKKSVSPPRKINNKVVEEKAIETWMIAVSYLYENTPITDVFLIPSKKIDRKLKNILLDHHKKSIDSVVVEYYNLNPGLKFKNGKMAALTVSNSITKLLDNWYPYLVSGENDTPITIKGKIDLFVSIKEE